MPQGSGGALVNLDTRQPYSYIVKMNKYYMLIVKKAKRIMWVRIISGKDSLL